MRSVFDISFWSLLGACIVLVENFKKIIMQVEFRILELHYMMRLESDIVVI